MTFANYGALLWLLPLGGAIVVLYLLKMRRRDVRVPATFLWPDKVEEIRANALFQRLKPNWLLFLQLLALALILFALARPQSMQRGLTGQVTVLVVDSSASMSATDVRPSRFAEAKRLVRDAIQSARPGDRIALIEAGPTPRVVFPLSSDPSRQLKALDAMEATDAEASVGEALRLASALVGSLDGARIVLLSDGDFEKVTNFSRGKAALVYQAIGEYDDNLAITALGAADAPGGRQLFCGVKNFGTKPLDGKLTLVADGRVIDSMKVPPIAPGSSWGDTVVAPAGAHLFEAKLDASDALKSDNYAATVSSPGSSLRVLLVSKGDPFLERALSLDPRVTLDRAAEVPTEAQAGSSTNPYDVVVFDGETEQPVAAKGVLTFGEAGEASPVTTKGRASEPTFVSSESTPLMEAVDLHGVYLDAQAVVQPKGVARTEASTSAGPLIVSSDTGAKRQVFVAFEPLNSDFPLQVAFPIFVANALDFLAGAEDAGAIAVAAGKPFSLPWTNDATLRTPSGDKLALKATGSTLVVRDAKQVGKYTLTMGKATREVFATLRSDQESDIHPVRNLSLGGGEVKATDAPMRFADLWRPLGLLALLVLAVEWWLFARRS